MIFRFDSCYKREDFFAHSLKADILEFLARPPGKKYDMINKCVNKQLREENKHSNQPIFSNEPNPFFRIKKRLILKILLISGLIRPSLDENPPMAPPQNKRSVC